MMVYTSQCEEFKPRKEGMKQRGEKEEFRAAGSAGSA
jgi:hypothetical protein